MDALVGTYACEWTEVVNNPERQKQFRQFVNTVRTCRTENVQKCLTVLFLQDERILGVENIVERKQQVCSIVAVGIVLLDKAWVHS
jgi:hypothetical protein